MPPLRIGFDHYTIAHRHLSADETLTFAQSHGFAGVQFLEPSSIDPNLDAERLASFAQRAAGMGLYLEVGLPSPNPIRRSREEDRTITAAEHARELQSHVDAVGVLGCRHARVYFGNRHDRFRTDVRWTTQCEASEQVLRLLAPQLRALGLRVAIETHADLTTNELLATLGRVGLDTTGVTLDTGNLLMRLDEPVRAVERLAPFVLATHIKDAVLAFTSRGLCWQARPVGSGALPMPDLLATLLRANPKLNLSIELHPRTYDLPIYDPTWLVFFPELTSAALEDVVSLARACEAKYSSGLLDRPEVIEAIPWADRDLDWLASSLGFLQPVVTLLARL